MFSVTNTELNVFPLCTRNVWPTKSGVTIERRDQVLIGFFAPEAFILSIFSRRYNSTKGPFFNDLAINCKLFVNPRFVTNYDSRLRLLLRSSPLQNKTVTRFVFTARFEAFRQLTPRTDRM